ncbi:MAG: discoidin domain-containing protein, partial [Candidatus Electrothrix sp. ATG1]|nr:discoidin domain-containing protein [Candidatus Electrothrix sp. ATG1]
MKKIPLITSLLWLILFGPQSAFAAPCADGEDLIALPNPGTWTATASSVHDVHVPGRAIDNLLTTGWHAAPVAFPHTLTVDMGAARDIGGIQVFPTNLSGYQVNGYDIQTSPDCTIYTSQTTGNLPIPTKGNYEAFFIGFPAEVSARCYRFVAVTGYGSLAYVPEVNPMVCAASDPAPTTPVFAP